MRRDALGILLTIGFLINGPADISVADSPRQVAAPLPPGAVARLGTPGMVGEIYSLAFSPDGTLLAAGCDDLTVRVWEAGSGLERLRLRGHTRDDIRVCFCAGGKRLGTWSRDGSLRLWDLDGGKQVFLRERDRGGLPATFSPDGQLVAAKTDYQTLTVFRTADGREVFTLRSELGDGDQLAFSPDSRLLAVGNPETVHVLDASDGRVRWRFNAPALALAFSPDGKQLAVAGRKTVTMHEATAEGEVRTFENVSRPARLLSFARDGAALFGILEDGSLRQWSTATGRQLAWKAPTSAPVAALSPDGGLLAVPSGFKVLLHDTATGTRAHGRVGHPHGVRTVLFSPDGKTLATVGGDLHLWEADTGRHLLSLNEAGRHAIFSPDGKHLLVSGLGAAFRLPDAPAVHEFRWLWGAGKSSPAPVLAFSPDGRTLAAGSSAESGKVALWDVAGKTVREEWTAHRGGVVALAFSPDGKLLATAGGDGTACLWEASTGKEMHRAPGHEGLEGIAFTPDGELVATTDAKAVRLWEVRTGKKLFELAGRQGGPAFTPDGRIGVTGMDDGSLRFWEAATGKDLFRLPGHPAAVRCVALSPDGRLLASGSDDTTALTWDLPALLVKQFDRPARPLAEKELDRLWEELAGEDARLAREAIGTLAAAGGGVVEHLKARLRPVTENPLETRLRRLIAELDHDEFTIREEASRELQNLGWAAEPMLRVAEVNGPSAEVRRRAEDLLRALPPRAKARHDTAVVADTRRMLRAVEVLERHGTAEARAVLRTLAGGWEGARETRDAKAALARLAGPGPRR